MADETAERGRRLLDTTSGRTITVPEARVEDFLKRENSEGLQRFRTRGNRSQGFATDHEAGGSRRRDFSDAEIFGRRRHGDLAGSVLATQGDTRFGQAQSAAVQAARRTLAEESNFTAFGQRAASVATFGVSNLIEEAITGEDVSEFSRELGDANPIASGLGGVAGVVPTLLGGTLLQGGRIGARGLLGFSGRIGQRVSSAVAGNSPGAVRSAAAAIAGRGVTSAAIDIPLSMQFQAADMADNNKSFSAEAMISQASTDVLWGWGFESAFGLAGVALRHGPLAAVGRGLSRMTKNPASRQLAETRIAGAAGEVARVAEEARRLNIEDLATMDPTKARGFLESVSGQGSAAGRTTSSAVSSTDDWLRIVDDSRTVIKAAPAIRRVSRTVAAGLDDVARNVVDEAGFRKSFSRGLARRNVDYAASSALAGRHGDQALHHLTEELGESITPDIRRQVQEAAASLENAKPGAAARTLQELRVNLVDSGTRAIGDGASATSGVSAKRHIDNALTDPAVWGDSAATSHREALDLADEIIDLRRGNIADLASGSKLDIEERMFSMMKGVTDATPAGEAGALMETLNAYNSVLAKADSLGISFPSGARRGVQKSLDSLGDNVRFLEATATLNRVRKAHSTASPAIRNVPLAASSDAPAEASGVLKRLGGRKLDPFRLTRLRVNSYETNRLILRSVAKALTRVNGVIQGLTKLGKVPIIGIFAFRDLSSEDKRESFGTIRDHIDATANNPDIMIGATEEMLSTLADTDPELATNIGHSSTNQLMYLANHIPRVPEAPLGGSAADVPLTDIDIFFDRYGALQAPESILFAVSEGTLTDEAADAVRTVYPELFVEMQLQLADTLGEADHVPYSVKVASSYMLGPGIDPLLDASFVLDLQDRSAQTEEQEAAQRGPAPSSRLPGFASSRQTSVGRQEAF